MRVGPERTVGSLFSLRFRLITMSLQGLLGIYVDDSTRPIVSALEIETDNDLAFLFASESQAAAGAAEVEGISDVTAARFGALWSLTRQVAEGDLASGTAALRVCAKVTRLEIQKCGHLPGARPGGKLDKPGV